MADQYDSGFHDFSLYKRVSLRTQIHLSVCVGAGGERERENEREISQLQSFQCVQSSSLLTLFNRVQFILLPNPASLTSLQVLFLKSTLQ